MNVKNIFIAILILVLLYIVFSYIYKDSSTLSGLQDGTAMTKIEASTLSPSSTTGTAASNFTYSIWFYVNDWNYRYGESKVVFGRMGKVTTGDTSTDNISGSEPCPLVALGSVENNLKISLACYGGADTAPVDGTTAPSVPHVCNVANVPIQKWVNLLISVYGRTLDVYIDGKLVKTSILPGVAKINNDAPVYITPKGGFAGWTSKFQYFPTSTDPQTAFNIYKAGYGGSMLGFLGKYKIKVSVINGDSETGSVEI